MSYFRFLLLALVFLTGSALISESAPVYMARAGQQVCACSSL